MNYEILTAFTAFAFVSSITPGPNNLMLMASGANFGFRRTFPHMLGVGLGFVFMVLLVGVGLIQIFDAFPVSYLVLKSFSVIYLLYLAWKIAMVRSPHTTGRTGTPMTFFQAALFQWVNPKAWAMAITAISVYTHSQNVSAIILVALVFGAINLPCVGSWVLLGQQMQRVLTNPVRVRIFNAVMASLLVASLYPVIF